MSYQLKKKICAHSWRVKKLDTKQLARAYPDVLLSTSTYFGLVLCPHCSNEVFEVGVVVVFDEGVVDHKGGTGTPGLVLGVPFDKSVLTVPCVGEVSNKAIMCYFASLFEAVPGEVYFGVDEPIVCFC